ncbi:hypothetical protein ACOME3_004418 [Neoechinorhynchus agilis]
MTGYSASNVSRLKCDFDENGLDNRFRQIVNSSVGLQRQVLEWAVAYADNRCECMRCFGDVYEGYIAASRIIRSENINRHIINQYEPNEHYNKLPLPGEIKDLNLDGDVSKDDVEKLWEYTLKEASKLNVTKKCPPEGTNVIVCNGRFSSGSAWEKSDHRNQRWHKRRVRISRADCSRLPLLKASSRGTDHAAILK